MPDPEEPIIDDEHLIDEDPDTFDEDDEAEPELMAD